jgi:hypothetical protein
MRTTAPFRVASSVFLAAAVALVAYGLFGLSHFAHYTGEYFDERMVLFDNGVYPFMWGVVLLLIGQLARLHYRRPAMLTAASAAIVIFAWQRTKVPAAVPGQSVFPDAGLLNELLVIAGVLLVLALADGAMAAGLRRIAKSLTNRQG